MPPRLPMMLLQSLEPRLLMTTLPAGFRETLFSGALGAVTNMDVLSGGRILVTEQSGQLKVIPAAGGPAKTILSIAVDSDGERGLLGVAHDPRFAANGFIYLYHTVPGAGGAAPFNEVTRYRMSGNAVVASSAVDILRLDDLSG